MTTSAIVPVNKPTASTTRLDYIDALRGFACLWVMLMHSYNACKMPPIHNPIVGMALIMVSIGWLGVHLFLTLSGFCLFYPLARKIHTNGLQLNTASFFKRRAHRILPAYYIALVIFSICSLIPFINGNPPSVIVYGVKDLLLHAAMLHNLLPQTNESINVVFWSLALESQLYLIFPLLVFLIRRGGVKAPLIATLIVTIIWQIIVIFIIHPSANADQRYVTVLHRALPGRCFEFAAGMTAAYFVANPAKYQTRISLILIALFTAPCVFYLHMISEYGLFIDQTWGIIFASIIIACSRIPQRYFISNKILAALTFLGTFSYSVYLIHFPLYSMLRSARFIPGAHGYKLIVYILIRLCVCIAIGYVFYLFAEKPFLNKKQSQTQNSG